MFYLYVELFDVNITDDLLSKKTGDQRHELSLDYSMYAARIHLANR